MTKMFEVLPGFLVSWLLVAAGCGGDDAPSGETTALRDAGVEATQGADGASGSDVRVDAAQAFQLTVTGGFGSGTYLAGETVHVWANVRPWTEIVTGWSGDDALLNEPLEWHTTFTMPARDATLTATVQERREVFEETTYKGDSNLEKAVITYMPAQSRGLVLMLHGTGGSARMITKSEAKYIALTAIARGYGVLATEAEEVVAGDTDGNDKIRWNPSVTSGNIDLANLNELIGGLRQMGRIEASTPLYVLGMSNGGAMSVSLGAVGDSPDADEYPNLRFQAAISFCASGHALPAQVTTTPTAWLLCENDDNDEVSNDDAATSSGLLQSRGIDTVLDEHAASPLYEQRFLRVEGIDETTSAAIAGELRTAGFVDAQGMFIVSSDDIIKQVGEAPASFPVLTSQSGGTLPSVREQIRVMEAEHQLYSDWANRAIDFFDAHQP